MKIIDCGSLSTDWSSLVSESVEGLSGNSRSKSIKYGNIRMRTMEYSPGFEADHWCPRGHIIFVLEGEITIKLKDETEQKISKGMSFICGDNETNPHMVYSKKGAFVIIID